MQMGWPNGSLEPELSVQDATDIPCITNDGDDSATESETELETEEKSSNYRDHRLSPMQSQLHEFSQLSNGHFTFLNENSQHKDSHYSQKPSLKLSLVDQASSIRSLPNVVKEFQSMFGSDEESYPPDFPMSLR